MKILKDLDVAGKRVFLRADLDVPMEETKDERLTTNAESATRLQNIKPTVDYLLEHGSSEIIIAGHVGRPGESKVESQKSKDGQDLPSFYDAKLSTKQLVVPLEKILGQKIGFLDNPGKGQFLTDGTLRTDLVIN